MITRLPFIGFLKWQFWEVSSFILVQFALASDLAIYLLGCMLELVNDSVHDTLQAITIFDFFPKIFRVLICMFGNRLLFL